MTEVLEIKNLSVRYPREPEPVLENLSINIEAGQVCLVIGPNGSGKTTLIRAILGLLPYQGEILLFGQPVRASYGNIGFVSQRFSFDATIPITVEEVLRLPLETRRAGASFSPESLDAVLKKVASLDLKRRPLKTLSGGQLQRVLLARALAGEPRFLILDEPEAGLDIGAEGTIYDLIAGLAREKKLTVLIATHELDIVSKYASQVICLNKKMVCAGPPEAVLNKETLEKLYGTDIKIYAHKH